MLRFNISFVSDAKTNSNISIHLMLRFNMKARNYYNQFWNFNTSYVTVQHRMILILGLTCTDFNTSYVTVQRFSGSAVAMDIVFQYILCYGSTYPLTWVLDDGEDFNTSYVTVQRCLAKGNCRARAEFQYILCYGSTRLMYLPSCSKDAFQYILCYGSTERSAGSWNS